MYRVIAKTDTIENCPGDSDGGWYEYVADGRDDQTGAVCLDYDWVVGECTSLPPEPDAPVLRNERGHAVDESGNLVKTHRIACDDLSSTNVWWVSQIVQGADSDSVCVPEEQGFVYEVRRFVVCAAQVPRN